MVNPEQLQKPREICFDFTKGCCTRPFCKYSHDISEIIQVNSQERGICFDFLRNQCHRGPLCRFNHDLSSIMQQQGQQEHTSAANPNAPICYDFVKGCCSRSECRYSHDITSVINSAKNHSTDELCFDFLRGKCTRGSACRYLHKRQLPGILGPVQGLPIGADVPWQLPGTLNAVRMQQAGVSLLQPMPAHLSLPPQLQADGNVLGQMPGMLYAASQQPVPLVTQPMPGLPVSPPYAPLNHDMVSQMAALQAFNSLRAAQQEVQRQAALSQVTSMGLAAAHKAQLSDEGLVGPGNTSGGMMAMGLPPKPQGLQEDILADKLRAVQHSMQAMPTETLDDDTTIGAHWEQQVARMPPLVTSRLKSQPPSGACTPRTPALATHHPFSIPSRDYQPSSLAPTTGTAAVSNMVPLAVNTGQAGPKAQEQHIPAKHARVTATLPAVAAVRAASAPSSRRASLMTADAYFQGGHSRLPQLGTARAAAHFEPRPASAAGLVSAAAHETGSGMQQPENEMAGRASCLLPTSADDVQLMSRLHQIWGTQPMPTAIAQAN